MDLIEMRLKLLAELADGTWKTARDLQTSIPDATASEVGNNLRFLKSRDMVIERRLAKARQWKIAPDVSNISGAEPTKLLTIAVPISLHEDLVRISKSLGISRTKYILKAILASVKRHDANEPEEIVPEEFQKLLCNVSDS